MKTRRGKNRPPSSDSSDSGQGKWLPTRKKPKLAKSESNSSESQVGTSRKDTVVNRSEGTDDDVSAKKLPGVTKTLPCSLNKTLRGGTRPLSQNNSCKGSDEEESFETVNHISSTSAGLNNKPSGAGHSRLVGSRGSNDSDNEEDASFGNLAPVKNLAEETCSPDGDQKTPDVLEEASSGYVADVSSISLQNLLSQTGPEDNSPHPDNKPSNSGSGSASSISCKTPIQHRPGTSKQLQSSYSDQETTTQPTIASKSSSSAGNTQEFLRGKRKKVSSKTKHAVKLAHKRKLSTSSSDLSDHVSSAGTSVRRGKRKLQKRSGGNKRQSSCTNGSSSSDTTIRNDKPGTSRRMEEQEEQQGQSAAGQELDRLLNKYRKDSELGTGIVNFGKNRKMRSVFRKFKFVPTSDPDDESNEDESDNSSDEDKTKRGTVREFNTGVHRQFNVLTPDISGLKDTGNDGSLQGRFILRTLGASEKSDANEEETQKDQFKHVTPTDSGNKHMEKDEIVNEGQTVNGEDGGIFDIESESVNTEISEPLNLREVQSNPESTGENEATEDVLNMIAYIRADASPMLPSTSSGDRRGRSEENAFNRCVLLTDKSISDLEECQPRKPRGSYDGGEQRVRDPSPHQASGGNPPAKSEQVNFNMEYTQLGSNYPGYTHTAYEFKMREFVDHKVEATEKSDKLHSDKGQPEDNEKPGEKNDKSAKGSPGKKNDKSAKGSPGEKNEKSGKCPPGEKNDKSSKGSLGEKNDKSAKGSPGEKNEKSDKSSPGENNDKSSKGSLGEKNDKSSKGSPRNKDYKSGKKRRRCISERPTTSKNEPRSSEEEDKNESCNQGNSYQSGSNNQERSGQSSTGHNNANEGSSNSSQPCSYRRARAKKKHPNKGKSNSQEAIGKPLCSEHSSNQDKNMAKLLENRTRIIPHLTSSRMNLVDEDGVGEVNISFAGYYDQDELDSGSMESTPKFISARPVIKASVSEGRTSQAELQGSLMQMTPTFEPDNILHNGATAHQEVDRNTCRSPIPGTSRAQVWSSPDAEPGPSRALPKNRSLQTLHVPKSGNRSHLSSEAPVTAASFLTFGRFQRRPCSGEGAEELGTRSSALLPNIRLHPTISIPTLPTGAESHNPMPDQSLQCVTMGNILPREEDVESLLNMTLSPVSPRFESSSSEGEFDVAPPGTHEPPPLLDEEFPGLLPDAEGFIANYKRGGRFPRARSRFVNRFRFFNPHEPILVDPENFYFHEAADTDDEDEEDGEDDDDDDDDEDDDEDDEDGDDEDEPNNDGEVDERLEEEAAAEEASVANPTSSLALVYRYANYVNDQGTALVISYPADSVMSDMESNPTPTGRTPRISGSDSEEEHEVQQRTPRQTPSDGTLADDELEARSRSGEDNYDAISMATDGSDDTAVYYYMINDENIGQVEVGQGQMQAGGSAQGVEQAGGGSLHGFRFQAWLSGTVVRDPLLRRSYSEVEIHVSTEYEEMEEGMGGPPDARGSYSDSGRFWW